MKRNYWPIGFAVLALGLLLPWFDPVTTPRFNGLNFPFAHSAYLWPRHFVFFSYGIAAIVVAGLGVVAWWMNKGLAVFCAGMLLLLGGMTFLQITSWEPTWLKMALEGGEDFSIAITWKSLIAFPMSSSVRRHAVSSSRRIASRALFGWHRVARFGVGLLLRRCHLDLRCWPVPDEGLDALKSCRTGVRCPFAGLGGLQFWRPIAAERLIASAERRKHAERSLMLRRTCVTR